MCSQLSSAYVVAKKRFHSFTKFSKNSGVPLTSVGGTLLYGYFGSAVKAKLMATPLTMTPIAMSRIRHVTGRDISRDA